MQPAISFSLCLALVLTCTACVSNGPLLRQAAELNARGARQLAQGDLDGAEASFQLALEYNNRFSEPHNNLGLVAMARGRMRDARRHFRAALMLNHDFAEAWSNLGIALSRPEDPDDHEASPEAAIHAFREALAIHPGLLEARINLVRMLLATGQTTEALTQSRRLVQIAESMALAHALRAEAALLTGHLSEAVTSAQTAQNLDHDDPEIRLVTARVDLARGEVESAHRILTELVNEQSVKTDARALLAAIYLARGDRHSAQRELAALGPAANRHPVARRVSQELQR